MTGVGPPPLPVVAPPWTVRVAGQDGPDVALVTRWMAAPQVEEFWHQAWPAGRWATEIAGQRAGAHSLPCLAARDGEPVAYLELYRVARDVLAGRYPDHPHDLGVHIAVDPDRLGRGLGRSLLRAVADGLLAADPDCRRVIAEPDAGNDPSLRAFAAAGFRHCGELALPDKTAALVVRPRTEEDLPIVGEPG